MTVVAVTQPYVPAYRVPLFNAIDQRLASQGLTLRVITGRPQGAQAARSDSDSGPWHVIAPAMDVEGFGHTARLRVLPRDMRDPAVLVTEFEAANTHAWRFAGSRVPVVLWGHGKNYVTRETKVGMRAKAALAHRSAAVMTYTPGGRDYVVTAFGLPADKVRAIGNATDSEALRAAYREVAESDRLAAVRGDNARPAALFVGGLDASKRTGFLLDAFEAAVSLDPGFRLIVVGAGRDAGAVRAVARHDERLTYVPDARGSAMAALGASAKALWMPGRVGLVAVDALAMGLPVHSCPSRWHAPEWEFLRGDELSWLPDEPGDFARESLRLMALAPAWDRRELRADIPTISGVADAFVATIESVLGGRS